MLVFFFTEAVHTLFAVTPHARKFYCVCACLLMRSRNLVWPPESQYARICPALLPPRWQNVFELQTVLKLRNVFAGHSTTTQKNDCTVPPLVGTREIDKYPTASAHPGLKGHPNLRDLLIAVGNRKLRKCFGTYNSVVLGVLESICILELVQWEFPTKSSDSTPSPPRQSFVMKYLKINRGY